MRQSRPGCPLKGAPPRRDKEMGIEEGDSVPVRKMVSSDVLGSAGLRIFWSVSLSMSLIVGRRLARVVLGPVEKP